MYGVVILAGLCLLARPQEETLLSVVPVDAEMVIHVRAMGPFRDRFAGTDLGRFLEDEAVREHFLPLARILPPGTVAEVGGEKPIYALLENVEGEVVGFLRPREEARGFAALVVRPGGKKDAFQAMLDRVKEKLSTGDRYRVSTDTFGEAEMFILDHAQERAGEGVLVLAEGGDTAVFAADSDREAGLESVRAVFDILAAGEAEAPTILDAPRFQEARERAGGPGAAELFLDVDTFLRGPAPAGAVPPSLGVDALDYFYARLDLGAEAVISAFFALSGEGLIADLAKGFRARGPNDLVRYVPAGSLDFHLIWMDVPVVYERGLELMARLDEDRSRKYREVYAKGMKGRLKIDPEKELLPHLDGRVALFRVPLSEEAVPLLRKPEPGEETRRVLPGPVLVLGLKDRTGFEKGFDKTLRALGLHVSLHKETFQGRTFFTIRPPWVPLAFCWAYDGDVFACSPFPGGIKAFLRAAEEGTGPPREIASVGGRYGGASALFMFETREVVKDGLRFFYETGVRKDGGDRVDISALVDRYFGGRCGFVFDVEGGGIRGRVITP